MLENSSQNQDNKRSYKTMIFKKKKTNISFLTRLVINIQKVTSTKKLCTRDLTILTIFVRVLYKHFTRYVIILTEFTYLHQKQFVKTQ